MDIFQLPGLAGWPATLLSFIGMGIYVFYMTKNTKSKFEDKAKEAQKQAEEIAKNANKEAIDAMQMHLNILRERVNEAEKENTRMHHTLDTIYVALKTKGIYITIDGDMIHIRDNGNSTTIRMKKDIA